MKIRITAGDGIVKSLSIDVSGFRVEVSDLEAKRTLVITEEGGSVFVSVPDIPSIAKAGIEASATKKESLPIQETIAPPKAETQEVVSASEAEKPSADADVSSIIKEDALPQKPESALLPTKVEKSSSDALFNKLSALRKQISTEAKLPAYTVFQDKSLHAMCEALPQDVQALRSIPGVGEARLAKYGSAFIEVIRQHLSEGVAA